MPAKNVLAQVKTFHNRDGTPTDTHRAAMARFTTVVDVNLSTWRHTMSCERCFFDVLQLIPDLQAPFPRANLAHYVAHHRKLPPSGHNLLTHQQECPECRKRAVDYFYRMMATH